MTFSRSVVSPPPGAPGIHRLLKAGRGFTQPDIWIVDVEGEPCVWKTWWRRPAWERVTVGRWLAHREGRIVAALQDLEGFPSFLGYPEPATFAMSLLDAEPVPEIKGGESLDEQYFVCLEAMIAEMHSRGINHGDLRRKNLLRAPGDPSTPRMVDFTQSLNFTPPVGGIRGIIFRQAIRIDRVTFLKLKRWYLGDEALSSEEVEEAARIPWHLKLGKKLRKKVYRPFKHWKQGKKRKKKAD